MMKKFLAIILALALVMSLVPATFAATRAEKTAYRYVFDRDVRTDFNGKDNMTLIDMECATTNTELSDVWGFNQRCYGSSYSLYDGYAAYGVYSSDAPVFINEEYDDGVSKAATGGVGFIIYVDEGGTFEPKLDYSKVTNGVTCEVYISPYSGTRAANASTMKELFFALKPEQRIGIIDGYATKTTRTSKTFKQVTLEKGYYNLCFVMNGVSDVESWKSTTTVPTTGGNAGRYSCGLRVHEFILNRDVEAHSGTEYTYNIGVEVLDYENMYVGDSNAEPLRDGFRKSNAYGDLPGVLLENLGLADYDAKYGTDKDGNALETPVYSMDLTKTDPWGILADTNKNWGKLALEKSNDYLGVRFEVSGYNNDETPVDQFLAIKVNVPKRGTYKLSFKPDLTSPTQSSPDKEAASIYAAAAAPKVYFKKLSEISNKALGIGGAKNPWYDSSNKATDFIGTTEMLCRFKFNDNWNEDWRAAGTVEVPEAGDYAIIFALDQTCLDAELGNATTTSDGKYQWICLDGIKLTLAKPEAAVEDVFDKKTNISVGNPEAEDTAYRTSSIKVVAADTQGNAIDIIESEAEQTIGKVKSVTAEDIDGYKFLYWARGFGTDKRIASWDKTYSFKAETGAIWLTAVYANTDEEKNEVSVAFYNANGDVLSRSLVSEGITFMTPALPSLAGYGEANGWVLSANGEEYGANEEITASGTEMLFVAKYPEDVVETVTVNGTEYKYGEKASITAYKRENGAGTGLFAYWTKDGEIVSFDRTLTFTAWEDCTYVPVYLDYTPLAKTVRKILIGYKNVGESSIAFADFIGLEGAVECGILFGGESLETATHKIAKKGNENMLSVIDDVTGDATGYAILSDGTVVYDK